MQTTYFWHEKGVLLAGFFVFFRLLVIFANNFTVCAKEVYTIITIYSYQSDYQCIFANAQTSIYVLPPPKIK